MRPIILNPRFGPIIFVLRRRTAVTWVCTERKKSAKKKMAIFNPVMVESLKQFFGPFRKLDNL